MGMIKKTLFAGLFLCSASALGLSQAAGEEPIRIGVISSLSGPFAQLGEDGVDGVKIALEEIGNKIDGREIQLFIEDGAADPSTAIEKARALVNRDKVQLILGPLSGSAGQAVKDSADEWPNATIVVAGAAAEDITMRGIKPNVFRTSYTGAQPTFPLGDYAYKQGYRKVAIVAEDYAFPYAQVGGFMSTFCSLGGKVPKKFWVPIGTSDFSPEFCTSLMANRLGARCINLLAPAIVSSERLHDELMREPMLVNQFRMIHAAGKVIFGVGDVGPESTYARSGISDEAGLAGMIGQGAVGVIIGRLIDAEGCPLPSPLEGRTIGITLDELKAMPVCICAAGGPQKTEAIRAGLRGGYATHLVTDMATARALLE